jgi:hypothetical protein
MENQIRQILSGLPDVCVTQVGSLWQVNDLNTMKRLDP